MENRNEDNLIDEFNELVSEISKSVFDKSIYRDLKLTEENLIKTLTSTSEKTATINRNNLISLQNNLKVILDEAIADFNLGVQQGEKAFEKKANEFLNNIEEVSTKSKENIYHLKEKAKETYDEVEKMNRSDMNYHDYSWTAVQGDNPRMTKLDATRFSRHEGYEVLDLINSFQAKGGGALTLKSQQIIEWMLHERLPSNIQGRAQVKAWVVDNFSQMKDGYPF